MFFFEIFFSFFFFLSLFSGFQATGHRLGRHPPLSAAIFGRGSRSIFSVLETSWPPLFKSSLLSFKSRPRYANLGLKFSIFF